MSGTPLLCTAVLLFLCLSPLPAAVMITDAHGHNSGWSVSWEGAVRGLTVIDVDSNASTLTISITKDFGPDEDDELPVAAINFTQVLDDANTVRRIIIQSETIANHTDTCWTEFRWVLLPPGRVDFNTGLSSGWDVSPFTTKTYLTTSGYKALVADGGTVPDGTNFTPSGNLVIDADLSAEDVHFAMKQIVVPEPTCLVLLGAGAAMLVRRRATR